MVSKQQFVLTFDVDWAPDCVIRPVARKLSQRGIHSTWFATHDSKLLQELEQDQLFEIGIHPNFLENSTQGNHPREILSNLKNSYPNSMSVRSHSLFQNTPLLQTMASEFDLEFDSSIYLPRTPDPKPHKIEFGNNQIWRFPFIWEDDFELMRNSPGLETNCEFLNSPGLKIFNFHPIHVILNSSELEAYNTLKSDESYPDVIADTLNSYINRKHHGIGDFFDELLNFLDSSSEHNHFQLKALNPNND